MKRIAEIDFLKGILILLVITFHLVYIEHLYPYAKQVVYTFHMPAFLLLSGYFRGKQKEPKRFLLSITWLAVPYAIMESGYIIMASILPISEHIDNLSVAVFLEKLLLNPIGPYWYLHTMILCESICYTTGYLVRGHGLPQMLLAVSAIYLCSKALDIVSFTMAAYFLFGFFLQRHNMQLTSFIKSSWLSVLLFAILITKQENLNPSTVCGILIVYTSMGGILLLSRYATSKGRQWVQYFGRNSLSLFLFSPMFTIVCKQFVPFLSFDPTGMAFLILSLTVCVSGSLLIAWAMDKLNFSRLMFGKKIYSGRI